LENSESNSQLNIRELEIAEDARCERWFRISDAISSTLKAAFYSVAAFLVAKEVAGKNTTVDAEITTNIPDVDNLVIGVALAILSVFFVIYRVQRSTISSQRETLAELRCENRYFEGQNNELAETLAKERVSSASLKKTLARHEQHNLAISASRKRDASRMAVLQEKLNFSNERIIELQDNGSHRYLPKEDDSQNGGSNASGRNIGDEFRLDDSNLLSDKASEK